MPDQDTITWRAPEFRHYEKRASWYITFSAIAILVIGFFIVQKDLFAAISIGILAILIILFSRYKPKEVEIELTTKGVHVGNIFVPHKQIKYFWVVYNKNHKTINLHTTTYINNMIILELEDQDPEPVREFLLNFLPEHEETNETLTQRISHKIRF